MAAGCDTGLRVKTPAVPPAPAPVAAPPLILAQTTVELPSPQPVPPESVPPRPPMDAPVAESAEPVIQIPRRVTAPSRGRPQDPARAAAPSAQTPASQNAASQNPAPSPAPQIPAAEAAEEVAGPLLSGEDLAKSNARIQARLSDLRRQLHPFANSANAGTKSAANRIGNFLRLADQELKRGDLRQADVMADRAQTLLQELAQR